MKAGAEEESLQSAIKGGNKDRIQKAIEGLPDPGNFVILGKHSYFFGPKRSSLKIFKLIKIA